MKENRRRFYKETVVLKTSNDPIADLIARVKNAIHRKKVSVIIPFSKIKNEILVVMKDEKYIYHFDIKEQDKSKYFIVYLKYQKTGSSIKGMRRISKPGLRIYTNASDMPRVLKGFGTAIISTSNGVMTDEQARSQNVGGEVLAYIW